MILLSWSKSANAVFESCILLVILSNVLVVVIDTDASLKRGATREAFYVFELASIMIFTVEYTLRLWCCTAHPRFAGCRGRLRYATRPLQLLDFLTLLPFYGDLLLEDRRARGAIMMRAPRLLRLVSLLRLERQLAAVTILSKVGRGP